MNQLILLYRLVYFLNFVYNMRRYIIIAVVVLISIGIMTTCGMYRQNKKLKEELSISVSNEKALFEENNSLENSGKMLQLTVEQLNYFNDSLLIEMNNVRKDLGVKDKNLKHLQYLLSEANKIDTIVYRDTIFRDNIVSIDTLIQYNKWYSLKLGLRFPNIIIAEPSFTSEKFIVVDYRRETIDPPSKCFIKRWFQKKHNVVEVEVIEKNPYIQNKKQRFIEIIK